MSEDSINMNEIGGVASGKVEGQDNVIGKGNVIYRDSVVVMVNLSAKDKTQLEEVVNMAKEVSVGKAGMAGQQLPENREAIGKNVDKLLQLLDKSQEQGKEAQTVQAGDMSISRVELLVKKAILLKAEADEIRMNQAREKKGKQNKSDDKLDLGKLRANFEPPARKAKLTEAYDLLCQANEWDPTNTEVLLHLAQLLIELTPDDPTDEERLLNRVRNLLSNPKDDVERFRLAQATFLLASSAVATQKESLSDARTMFERIGRSDWVRQCDELLQAAGVQKTSEPTKTADPLKNMTPPPLRQTPVPPVTPGGFQPIGNWQIQVSEGSLMYFNMRPDGSFNGTQQNPLLGINIAATGQWAFFPQNQLLQIQGLIQGQFPFFLGIMIQGPNQNGFTGIGNDGHMYYLTRIS